MANPNESHLPIKKSSSLNPNEKKQQEDFEPFTPEHPLNEVRFQIGYALQYFLKASRDASLSQSEVRAAIEGDNVRVSIKDGRPDRAVIQTLLGSLGGAVEEAEGDFIVRAPDITKVKQLIDNVNEAKSLVAKLEALQAPLGIDQPVAKAREDGNQPAFIIECDYFPADSDDKERQHMGRELHARLAGGSYNREAQALNPDCQAPLQQALKRTRNDDASVYTYQLEVDARRPEPARQFHRVLNQELQKPMEEKFAKLMADAKIPAKHVSLSLGASGEMPFAKFVIVGDENRAAQIARALQAIGLPAETIYEKPLQGVKCLFPVPQGMDASAAITHVLEKAVAKFASDPAKFALPPVSIRR